jgi:hypothetical protein
MTDNDFDRSYLFKLVFYVFVLALPAIIMGIIETMAADSSISVSSGDPTRFFAFLVYFLPGLIWTKKVTDSWWRTLGIGIAYALISPAYYLAALQISCNLGGHCVSV